MNAYLHMTCIYPRSGARKLQRFAILKYECSLCDVSMNMEWLVVGASNWVIHNVILYLKTQNLSDSEIYWRIVKTFGENVITKQKVFRPVLHLFCNKFRYHLDSERLN